MDNSTTTAPNRSRRDRRQPKGSEARLPPHSPEAERGVLGCILTSPIDCLAEVVKRGVRPNGFYDLRHQTIFGAMVELSMDGTPVDVVTVADRLKDNPDSGGLEYLATLPDAVPSPTNLPTYLDIVQEQHQLRQIVRTCTETVSRVYDHQGGAGSLLSRIRDDIEKVCAVCANGAPKYLAQSIGSIQVPVDGDPDELLLYRFLCRGGAWLIAAPTGIGKSVLAIQMMLCFGVGRSCLGFKPTRPLKSIYIQAENDNGDVAEIREGIYKGLSFSESERSQATANVKFVTCDDLCGPEFIHRCLEPQLRAEKWDLVWIDPLLAYIGGELTQAVVSPWLRNHLNPVLHRHGVGCVLVHHTNKPPSGREKPDWRAGDFAYIGSGTSDLANWPRAITAIRSIGSHTVYELILGKRGSRARWRNPDGSTCFSRFVAHGKDGIFWREATEDEIPEKTGRKAGATVEQVVDLLTGELSATDWQKSASDELGISRATFYRLKQAAIQSRRAAQSKVSRKYFKTP